jgi:hypothetical protein
MLTDQEIESVFGFNPAPGNPSVMWDLHHRVASRATTLTQAADGLDRVSADAWMGHGADSFKGTLHNLRRDVHTAAGAHTDYASALYAYVSEQESARTQAQSLAQEALAARQAHQTALKQNDHARADAAQAELDGVVRRARSLQSHMDHVSGQAARKIDAAAERAPYAPPGWLQQAWDGITSAAAATWHFVSSPEFLHGLSTVLSVVSAVCAFIPGLQGVALVAAALSIVTDVLAQVAAGQPVNWWMVGLSAALVFIPGGRLTRLFRDVPPEMLVETAEETGAVSRSAEGGLFRASRGGTGPRPPMNHGTVQDVASRYGVDISDVKIRLRPHRIGYEGATLPDQTVHLTRDAFQDEQTLARTLFHERFHVDELRQGLPYPRNDAESAPYEDRAYDAEERWWADHPLNPANQGGR